MILILLINLVFCKECKVYNETEIEFEKCNNCSSFKIKLNDILYIGNDSYKVINIKELATKQSGRIGLSVIKTYPEEQNPFNCRCHQYTDCKTRENEYNCIAGDDMYWCNNFVSGVPRICNNYGNDRCLNGNCYNIFNIDKKQLKLQSLNMNQNKFIERTYKSDKDKKQGLNINENDEYLINYIYVYAQVTHEKYHYIYTNLNYSDYEEWYVPQTYHELEIYIPNNKFNNCEIINITRSCKCEEKCLTKLYVKNYPCLYDIQSIFCDEYVENMNILKEDCDEIIYKSESSSENIISDDFSDIYSSTNRISVINILIFVYFLLKI